MAIGLAVALEQAASASLRLAFATLLPMPSDLLAPLQLHQYALNRADQQVAVQVNAISNRMTWLILSQAFLVGAFVTSSNIQTPGFSLGVESIVTTAGFFTCLWLRTGIKAALSAMAKAKRARQVHIDFLQEELNEVLPAIQLEDCEHRLGNVPAERIPTLLLAAWVALFGLLCWRAAYLMIVPLPHLAR